MWSAIAEEVLAHVVLLFTLFSPPIRCKSSCELVVHCAHFHCCLFFAFYVLWSPDRNGCCGCRSWKWSIVCVACAALLAPLLAAPFHSPSTATLYAVMASLVALLAVLSALDASPIKTVGIASAVAPWVILVLQGVRLFQRRQSLDGFGATRSEPSDHGPSAEETPAHRRPEGSRGISLQSRRQELTASDSRRAADSGSTKPPAALRALVVLICSHQQRARLLTRSRATAAK